MDLHDFYFDLPESLIAQSPLENRDSSRLLMLDKKTGDMKHTIFSDIVNYIKPNDCIVLNETRVIPARILGERKNTGAKIEFLLLKRIDDNKWEVLVRPGRRAKVGDIIVFSDNLEASIENITSDGNRIVRFIYNGIFEEILDQIGEMPLPPYITQKLEDKERYQTVYSKYEGSAAAPTAGLHFTNELLDNIKNSGTSIAKITLHVGLGTFRPVKTENILEHKIHSEYYNITAENADIINKTKQNGGKIIAVGTTSVRTLESAKKENGLIKPCSGNTNIFIYPGYKFEIIDNLITNFHLPESTLIMLVSALCGRENILKAYEEAIDQQYRFFSFGDAMFIH